MLTIRLTRTGKRGQPHYRIIVTERRSKRDGKYLESLGHYNPLSIPKVIQLDRARYTFWVGKGAQPSATVKSLYQKTLTTQK